MGIAFDACKDRPDHIEQILNGLDRYNPETTTIFQDYVTQQCEDRTYDCYANLALLKLYVVWTLVEASSISYLMMINVSYYLTSGSALNRSTAPEAKVY